MQLSILFSGFSVRCWGGQLDDPQLDIRLLNIHPDLH